MGNGGALITIWCQASDATRNRRVLPAPPVVLSTVGGVILDSSRHRPCRGLYQLGLAMAVVSYLVDRAGAIAMNAIWRSPLWPAREKLHLLAQPNCLVCGRSHMVVPCNVHHRYPFNFVIALGRPDLELDERNLFTLCIDPAEQHHILIGHLDDYLSYNPNLAAMMALCRGLTSVQIRSLHEWQVAKAARPKHLHDMTQAEKDALRAELDRLMPRRFAEGVASGDASG